MEKVANKICTVLMPIGWVLVSGVVLCASVDVFNRLALGASLAWAQQMAVWLNVGTVFVILPVMVIKGGHIQILFIYNKLKGLTKRIVTTIHRIALVVYSSLLLWAGVEYVVYLKSRHITRVFGTMNMPYYIVALVVPIGMFVTLIFGVYLFTSLREREENKEQK